MGIKKVIQESTCDNGLTHSLEWGEKQGKGIAGGPHFLPSAGTQPGMQRALNTRTQLCHPDHLRSCAPVTWNCSRLLQLPGSLGLGDFAAVSPFFVPPGCFLIALLGKLGYHLFCTPCSPQRVVQEPPCALTAFADVPSPNQSLTHCMSVILVPD